MIAHIKKCLLPVAGHGTRFLPVTKSIAKEMLPILDTPLMQYAVSEAHQAGICDINIVLSKEKTSIKHYFTKDENRQISSDKQQKLAALNTLLDECQFNYTYQEQANGLGDAIYCGKTLIGNEPFTVILPDDLCINDGQNVIAQMLDIYREYQCSIIAVKRVADSEIGQYGIIEGEKIANNLHKIIHMVEKPHFSDTKSRLAIVGRYVLSPNIFSMLAQTTKGSGGEIQITDALLKESKQQTVLAYEFDGKRYDCGRIDGFLNANNYFYQQHLKRQ